MSKEFECLDRIDKRNYLTEREHKEFLGVVESALTEYEAIKNAEPGKALECLEKLKGMEISSMPFSDEYGTQEVDLNDIRKVGSQLNTDFREYTTTIKQALLKAQEPKHYLKWEDLEFKETHKIKILMNGNLYNLLCYDEKYIEIRTIKGEYMLTLDNDNSEDKQFFNDLRLERVEE